LLEFITQKEVLDLTLYETMIIVKPDLKDEQLEVLRESITGSLEEEGLKPIKVVDLGVRNLAYRIQKENKGHYLLIYFEADGEKVEDFQGHLRLMEGVMRYMTVKAEGGIPDKDIVIPDYEEVISMRRTRVHRGSTERKGRITQRRGEEKEEKAENEEKSEEKVRDEDEVHKDVGTSDKS